MAKRLTGVGNNKTSRSKKTTKRLVAKKEMLAKKALKPALRKAVKKSK